MRYILKGVETEGSFVTYQVRVAAAVRTFFDDLFGGIMGNV